MNRLTKCSHSIVWRWLARLVRKRGYVLLPIWEIEIMEAGGQEALATMRRMTKSERDIGYFNGIADHASKTAWQYRDRYLPNSQINERPSA